MSPEDGPGPRSNSSLRSALAPPRRSSQSSSSSTASFTAPPRLPPRPDDSGSEASPRMPPRDDSPHPGFTDPSLHHHRRLGGEGGEEEDYLFPRPGQARGRSPPATSASPPRRRLTSGNIPTNSVAYSRNPEKVVAYLIPLPVPTKRGQQMNVPQRYMIYTPPAPHLLKPLGSKEGKRHKVKRVAQQEIRKAKTYEGKTLSLRGLHSKALRGVDRALAAIRSADVTFLNRVPRSQVDELVLLHPTSVLAAHAPSQTHDEFAAQLGRARRRAAEHSLLSIALFPLALALDTVAVVVWPFGGLAEVDAAWAWASVSGYLTARSLTRRLDVASMVTAPLPSPPSSLRSGGSGGRGENPFGEPRARRDSRQVRFQEDLDEEDEKLRAGKRKRNPLKVRFVPDGAMATMESYFLEQCHRRNPRAFRSPGVPPTQTDVLSSIGWWPDRRGRAPGVEREGDWEDENWQTRQAKEDLERVMKKAAKQWDKWCKSYARYPERAMGEKGHSRTSELMRKLRLKKDAPPAGTKEKA